MNDFPKIITDYTTDVLPKLEGWCSPKKAEALAKVVLETKPEIVVEIGVFAGRSLIALALACKCNDRGLVYGIDPWLVEASLSGFEHDKANHDWWKALSHEDIYRRALASCMALDVMKQAVLIRATSAQMVPLMHGRAIHKGFLPFIDLLHIDGNHSEPHSMYDVANYVPLVRKGGIVCFDDTNWECTKKAQELLAESCKFLYAVEDVGQECKFYSKK